MAMYWDASCHDRRPAIVPRPSEWSGSWALGCALCSRYTSAQHTEISTCGARAGKWANFSVRHTVRKKDILLHCKKSEYHKLAWAKYGHQLEAKHSHGSQHVTATADSQAAESGHGVTSTTSSNASECIHGVAVGHGANVVPRPDRFLAAIASCSRASSAQAYQEECNKSDLNTPLPSTGVLRDAGHTSRAKILVSTHAVMKEADQRQLRKAKRLAFAEDDRAQVKALRVRVVVVDPKVEVREYLGGLLRDWGFSAQESADATIKALRGMCYVQAGRRSVKDLHTGDGDGLDQELWEHVRSITFCGASDGAKVALQGL